MLMIAHMGGWLRESLLKKGVLAQIIAIFRACRASLINDIPINWQLSRQRFNH